jgi:hypothetical protein
MNIDDSCEAIRKLIQDDLLPKDVYEEKASSQMRSSLDVIEDCQLAIDSYFVSTAEPGSGECYPKVYGILQVLFVQQDAVANLFQVLNRTLGPNAVLQRIRETRNRATGHPTKKNEGKQKHSFHFISRMTLTQDGFQLRSESERAKDTFEPVDIRTFIRDQGRELTAILADLANKLQIQSTTLSERGLPACEPK